MFLKPKNLATIAFVFFCLTNAMVYRKGDKSKTIEIPITKKYQAMSQAAHYSKVM